MCEDYVTVDVTLLTMVPRLELCGAVLLAILMNTHKRDLEFPLRWCTPGQIQLLWWAGSTAHTLGFVFMYLTVCTKLLNVFMATTENPSDSASRQMMPKM